MLIFIHIPKTGGTSVYDWFNRCFPNRTGWYAPTTSPVSLLGSDDFRAVTDSYGGHFTFLDVKEFLRPDDVLLSLLRDPCERVASYYNHVTRLDQHPLHYQVRNRSVRDAAEQCPQFRSEISNAQCWFLSGCSTFASASDCIDRHRIQVFRNDQMENFSRAVHEASSLIPLLPIPRSNVAEPGYHARLSDDDWAFIEESNQEDIKLYHQCRAPKAAAEV